MVLSFPAFPTLLTALRGPFSSSLCHLLCSPDSALQVSCNETWKQWTLWVFQSVHHASKFWSVSSPQILTFTSFSTSLWLYLECVFSSQAIPSWLHYSITCLIIIKVSHIDFLGIFSFKFVKMLSHLIAKLIIKELFLSYFYNWFLLNSWKRTSLYRFGVLAPLKALINWRFSRYVLLLFCLFLCFYLYWLS